MKLIKLEDMSQMPWKNGHGTTTEIAISPAGASLSDGSFFWRISMADVRSAGPFSKFPGYDRIIAVVEGRGMRLNGHFLPQFVPFRFEGEDSIFAEPDQSIRDIGIIYRRDSFRVGMRTIGQGFLNLSKGQHFIVAIKTGFEIAGDTLRTFDALELNLEATAGFKCESLNNSDNFAILISIETLD